MSVTPCNYFTKHGNCCSYLLEYDKEHYEKFHSGKKVIQVCDTEISVEIYFRGSEIHRSFNLKQYLNPLHGHWSTVVIPGKEGYHWANYFIYYECPIESCRVYTHSLDDIQNHYIKKHTRLVLKPICELCGQVFHCEKNKKIHELYSPLHLKRNLFLESGKYGCNICCRELPDGYLDEHINSNVHIKFLEHLKRIRSKYCPPIQVKSARK